jgi:putative ABC transport system ATP-binding protein
MQAAATPRPAFLFAETDREIDCRLAQATRLSRPRGLSCVDADNQRVNTGSPHPDPSPAPAIAGVDEIVIARDLRKIYGTGAAAVAALSDVSLRIRSGRTVALLGRSGSGKSTLLNLLGAVDRPSAGRVWVGGVELSGLSEAKLALFRRRRLGFVFQSFHLLPDLRVFDNVAVPWSLDRAMNPSRRREILDLLDRLGLSGLEKRYPDELSGGQQQRVALARAVVHRPALVLADEPTGNLDAHSGRAILDLLMELQRESNVTVIVATHSQEAAERCDQWARLEDGRIVDAGVRGGDVAPRSAGHRDG